MEEYIMTYFRVLHHHFPGRIEETHRNFGLSRYSLAQDLNVGPSDKLLEFIKQRTYTKIKSSELKYYKCYSHEQHYFYFC
jgi:hypothetical protein